MMDLARSLVILTAVFKGCETQLPECSECRCCNTDGCKDTVSSPYCVTGCKEGYWGYRCYNKCPSECITCGTEFGQFSHATNDLCYKCANGYYNAAGVANCSTRCPNNCIVCSSATVCSVCRNGFYNGYEFDDKTKIYKSDCSLGCHRTCFNCTSYGKCDTCQAGYYGQTCNLKCSVGCKSNRCHKMVGDCVDGCSSENITGDTCDTCIDGNYGYVLYNCSKSCPSKACHGKTCDAEKGICNYCNVGRFGHYCNKTCSIGCLNSKCQQNNGSCTNGCKNGFSGDKCCTHNCVTCYSPYECSRCIDGFFGTYCSSKCPKSCVRCIKETGVCETCRYGFYGQFCNNNCSKNCGQAIDPGKSSVENFCGKDNGECLLGCTVGYTGDRCMDSKTSSTDQENIILPVVITAVIVLVLCAGTMGVYLFVKRRLRKKSGKSIHWNSSATLSMRSNTTTNTVSLVDLKHYETLDPQERAKVDEYRRINLRQDDYENVNASCN